MKGKRPLSDEEVSRIVCDGFTGRYQLRDRALFSLGVTTGFRVGTLLKLQLKHVYMQGTVVKHISLPASYFKRRSQGQSKRLSENSRQYLREWIRELITWDITKWYEENSRPGDVYLFQSQEGYNESLSYPQSRKVIIDACQLINSRARASYTPGCVC